MGLEFAWPPLPGGEAPRWDGRAFTCLGQQRRVLHYGDNQAAWDQDLTAFHEEQAGSDHYIDRASRREALAELKRRVKEPAAILEVGSSSGFLLPMVQKAFPSSLVIGSDSFGDSLEAMAPSRPGIPLVQFDLTSCPFRDASLDALVLLNVLEHIEDDARALSEMFRILKPGGVAVVEVPAGSWLYDIYDELLRHYRRYDMPDLKRKARAAGFKILRASHLGFLIYPAFALVKRMNRRRLSEDARNKEDRVARQIRSGQKNLPMEMVMGAEYALGRLLPYPFGIRCLVTLQRPLSGPSGQ